MVQSEGFSAKVVSCGYRSVYIQKSGLSFPAWQVQVNDEYFVWRCKRDFWRIGRHGVSLPKAAWKKLSDESPWRNPDFERGHDDRKDNWQPVMTKNLLQVNQFLENAEHKCRKLAEDSELKTLWEEFCRPIDSEGIHSQSEGQNLVLSSTTLCGDPRVGNQLGQYFCSKLNAQQLVQTFLKRLGEQNLSQITVLEPSCGYGNIVTELCDGLANTAIRAVVGIDIDPVAIDHCLNLALSNDADIQWKQRNFLEARLEDILVLQDVAIIGGPPYSAGAGNGKDGMQLDLPVRFIKHSIFEFKAKVVCFLMPERCKAYDYADWLPTNYSHENIALKAPPHFYFQGKEEPVLQPSIIQCVWQSDALKSG